MKQGTEITTDCGVVHIGDIVTARVYCRTPLGGTERRHLRGEFIYFQPETRFAIKESIGIVSPVLSLSEMKIEKKWDE